MSEKAMSCVEKMGQKFENAKKEGIQCGCKCGGWVDFEKPIPYAGGIFYPCKKCGLLHNSHNGSVAFFTRYSRGYHYKDVRVEYEPVAFSDEVVVKTEGNINPKAVPCKDNSCTGVVDTTSKILIAFTEFTVCKKCSLIHTVNGDRQLFTYSANGYSKGNEIVFKN